jgi:two-component system alkaline phosphatase synthesis response regulator PhoP
MQITNTKILVVDDEPDILEFLKYNLEKAGYITSIAEDGETAIKKAIADIPDLILLDIMMPGMDGVQTCYELRKINSLDQTLITFLTARSEEYSEIAGLDAGADDYIQKPIRPRLLLSRIKALLRRKSSKLPSKSENLIEFDDLTVDQEKMIAILAGEKIVLAKKEFEILLLLAKKPGKVFSRDEIFRKVWGYSVSINSRTIDVHISKLRDKLGEKYIKTLKGVGYKLDA